SPQEQRSISAMVEQNDGRGKGQPSRSGPFIAVIRPVSSGQLRHPHQVAVAFARGLATFVDGPDDERLTAAAVPSSEHALHVGGILAVFSRIPAHPATSLADADTELLCGRGFRSEKAQR